MGSGRIKFSIDYYDGDYFEVTFLALEATAAVGPSALKAAFDEAIAKVPADKLSKVGGFRMAFLPKKRSAP